MDAGPAPATLTPALRLSRSLQFFATPSTCRAPAPTTSPCCIELFLSTPDRHGRCAGSAAGDCVPAAKDRSNIPVRRGALLFLCFRLITNMAPHHVPAKAFKSTMRVHAPLGGEELIIAVGKENAQEKDSSRGLRRDRVEVPFDMLSGLLAHGRHSSRAGRSPLSIYRTAEREVVSRVSGWSGMGERVLKGGSNCFAMGHALRDGRDLLKRRAYGRCRAAS